MSRIQVLLHYMYEVFSSYLAVPSPTFSVQLYPLSILSTSKPSVSPLHVLVSPPGVSNCCAHFWSCSSWLLPRKISSNRFCLLPLLLSFYHRTPRHPSHRTSLTPLSNHSVSADKILNLFWFVHTVTKEEGCSFMIEAYGQNYEVTEVLWYYLITVSPLYTVSMYSCVFVRTLFSSNMHCFRGSSIFYIVYCI